MKLYTAQDPVAEELLTYLTEKTVGFSGADIRLLTTEASMCALRRSYPQIYRSQNKHILEYESIKVKLVIILCETGEISFSLGKIRLTLE